MKYLIYPLLSLSICFGLSAVEDQNSLKVFESVIQPVFSAKCIHCHGTEKNKGKLRMHTKEDLLKGGSGAGEDMIVAGDSESSELIFRITLPKEDDEAMPPLEDEEHYNPVTSQELAVIKSWIELEASFDLMISQLEEKAKQSAIHVLENMPQKTTTNLALKTPTLPQVKPADPNLIKSLSSKGLLVMPIAQNTNAIYVNASYLGKVFDDEMIKLLHPLAEQLLWLNVARTGISDAAGPSLSKFSLLTRLHMENTNSSDAVSPHLSKLSNLKYLNLYGTKVSDASVAHLRKLSNLEKVFLWETNFTKNGASQLRKSFVDADRFDVLQSNQQKFSKLVSEVTNRHSKTVSAIEEKLAKVGAISEDKTALNEKCPVANKPAADDMFSVFEGRKIAFCCEKCKTKFNNDPASFRSKINGFQPSSDFAKIAESLKQAQLDMDNAIEAESSKPRSVSAELRSLGPEINMGWLNN